jgi:hypothetical protein
MTIPHVILPNESLAIECKETARFIAYVKTVADPPIPFGSATRGLLSTGRSVPAQLAEGN